VKVVFIFSDWWSGKKKPNEGPEQSNKREPENSFLIIYAIVILSGCTIPTRAIAFPKIDHVDTLRSVDMLTVYYDLSSDGTEYITNYGIVRNVQTDEKVTTVDSNCIWRSTIDLSHDNRYLTGSTDLNGIGIFDIQKNECIRPENPTSLNPVESWSPESNRFILAQSKIIMDFPSFQVVPFSSDYPMDFTASTHIFGSGRYLWDTDSNLPVAELVTDCDGCLDGFDPSYPNISAIQNLKIASIDTTELRKSGKRIEQALLTEEWLSYPFFPIFDPTGEFVLVPVDIRNQPSTPTNRDDYDKPEYIHDTVIYLIHWRTKEKIEFLRLSNYGSPQHYISAPIIWSADGSTILIPRWQATPLVVSVK
jgi:hypothetical protein